MRKILRTDLPLRALPIGLAAIAPMAFPAARAGYGTLHNLAYLAIIPAAVSLVLVWALLRRSSAAGLAAVIRDGAVAGAVATVSLEAVRYSGFRMGFMPGNVPELMAAVRPLRSGSNHCVHSRRVSLSFFGIIFAVGGSICRVGGRFPTAPLSESVSSSVPRSRAWASVCSE
jgi:hypothetical protein